MVKVNYFNPRHLDAFISAIDNGSMAKAAGQLHMGQPALSQAIANLEDIAGVKLITRTTRSLKLTPAGEVFYKDAQRVLDTNKRLMKNIALWSNSAQGRISILAIPSIAHFQLPAIVKKYLAIYPDVAIEVHDNTDLQLRHMLDAGEGDFAFISKTSKDTDLKYLPILKDPLRWIGLKSDPLAAKKKIELKDMQDRQLIVLRQGAIREMVEPLLSKIKSPLPMIEVDQQSTLIGMVAAGLGISFLPSLSCQSWGNPETTHRALGFGDFHRIIQITRYVDQDLMPCATEFIRLYLREIQDSKFNSKDGVELIPVTEAAMTKFLNK